MKAPYISFRKTPQFYRTWGGSIMCDLGGGCNLKCSFCWARWRQQREGSLKSPSQVYAHVLNSGMGVACLTCSEPLFSANHIIELAQIFAVHEKEDPQLIIETNGVLLSKKIAKAVGIYDNIYIRVSIKGVDAHDFAKLTGAPQKTYEQIWKNIAAAIPHVNMWVAGISYEKDWSGVLERCQKIDPDLTNLFEVEIIKKYSR